MTIPEEKKMPPELAEFYKIVLEVEMLYLLKYKGYTQAIADEFCDQMEFLLPFKEATIETIEKAYEEKLKEQVIAEKKIHQPE